MAAENIRDYFFERVRPILESGCEMAIERSWTRVSNSTRAGRAAREG